MPIPTGLTATLGAGRPSQQKVAGAAALSRIQKMGEAEEREAINALLQAMNEKEAIVYRRYAESTFGDIDDPTEYLRWLNLKADVLRDVGRIDDAEDTLRKAFELRENHAKALKAGATGGLSEVEEQSFHKLWEAENQALKQVYMKLKKGVLNVQEVDDQVLERISSKKKLAQEYFSDTKDIAKLKSLTSDEALFGTDEIRFGPKGGVNFINLGTEYDKHISDYGKGMVGTLVEINQLPKERYVYVQETDKTTGLGSLKPMREELLDELDDVYLTYPKVSRLLKKDPVTGEETFEYTVSELGDIYYKAEVATNEFGEGVGWEIRDYDEATGQGAGSRVTLWNERGKEDYATAVDRDQSAITRGKTASNVKDFKSKASLQLAMTSDLTYKEETGNISESERAELATLRKNAYSRDPLSYGAWTDWRRFNETQQEFYQRAQQEGILIPKEGVTETFPQTLDPSKLTFNPNFAGTIIGAGIPDFDSSVEANDRDAKDNGVGLSDTIKNFVTSIFGGEFVPGDRFGPAQPIEKKDDVGQFGVSPLSRRFLRQPEETRQPETQLRQTLIPDIQQPVRPDTEPVSPEPLQSIRPVVLPTAAERLRGGEELQTRRPQQQAEPRRNISSTIGQAISAALQGRESFQTILNKFTR